MKTYLLLLASAFLSCHTQNGSENHSTVQEDTIMIDKDSVNMYVFKLMCTTSA